MHLVYKLSVCLYLTLELAVDIFMSLVFVGSRKSNVVYAGVIPFFFNRFPKPFFSMEIATSTNNFDTLNQISKTMFFYTFPSNCSEIIQLA